VTVRITVRLFASLREKVGHEERGLELPASATAGDAWAVLVQQYPSLGEGGHRVLMALNRRYVGSDAALSEGDELALFPPVSGG
jgi:MoaE-MoaD fusion protein